MRVGDKVTITMASGSVYTGLVLQKNDQAVELALNPEFGENVIATLLTMRIIDIELKGV